MIILLQFPQKQAPPSVKKRWWLACRWDRLMIRNTTWTEALHFGPLFKLNSAFAVSLLIYSLVDVCLMCCRGTPSRGSHVRAWRRRMTLKRDLERRLEDSLTGNLWPASALPWWPLDMRCWTIAASTGTRWLRSHKRWFNFCGKKRMKDQTYHWH